MYTLYKNPIQMETLAIVQYLYHNNIFILPTVIVERNHPDGIILPAIYDHKLNTLYEGIDECVKYYEIRSGISNLLENAQMFKEQNPQFRIWDKI